MFWNTNPFLESDSDMDILEVRSLLIPLRSFFPSRIYVSSNVISIPLTVSVGSKLNCETVEITVVR